MRSEVVPLFIKTLESNASCDISRRIIRIEIPNEAFLIWYDSTGNFVPRHLGGVQRPLQCVYQLWPER
jgi:hypothetical protein